MEQPVIQQTIVTQIMERVKGLIASGQYKPGERLPTEQELATRFGVGRSSIREALKIFQHLGVVESKAAKGTFVRDRAHISVEAITWALLLGHDDLRDVFELRVVIERACFRRLAQGWSTGVGDAADAVQGLETQIAVMRRAAEVRDVEALVEADYRFHQTIIGAGQNALFAAMYQTLSAFMRQEILSTYQRLDDLGEVAQDHQEIVHALTQQSPEAAEMQHRSHFRRIESLLAMDSSRGNPC